MSGELGEIQVDVFSGLEGDDLADELRARVKGELEPGERLLWAGASLPPPPSATGYGYLILALVELLLLLTGVGFVILAKLGSRAHFNRDSPIEFGVLLCVFACFALSVTIAVWFYARGRRPQQSTPYYAVTDRRVIRWQPEQESDAVRIVCLRRGQIHQLVRIQRPDGSGSLEFHRRPQGRYFPSSGGFQWIPDVRRVEQIIRHNLMSGEKSG